MKNWAKSLRQRVKAMWCVNVHDRDSVRHTDYALVWYCKQCASLRREPTRWP